jgi:hypothetical protein
MAKSKALDLLNQASTAKSATSKKSSIPSCKASPAIEAAMADFATAKTDEDNAKARRADAESRMVGESQRLRLEHCKKDGTLYNSIKLAGSTNTLTFTQKNQCKKISTADCEPKIRSIVGNDDIFDKYFDVKNSYAIDVDALMALPDADEIAAALATALGNNSHILKHESVIVPKEDFYHDRIFDKNTERMAVALENDGLVVPFKPSFK